MRSTTKKRSAVRAKKKTKTSQPNAKPVSVKASRRSNPRQARKADNSEKTGRPGKYRVGNKRPPKATQFKPGQSGNPNGRPVGSTKGSQITRLIKDSLEFQAPRQAVGISNGEAIAEQLIKKARGGNMKAIELVLDRIEGKARQRIEVGGVDGGAIPVSVVDSIDRFYGKPNGRDEEAETEAGRSDSKPS